MSEDCGNCECGAPLADAGPIGLYCTSKECPVVAKMIAHFRKALMPMKLWATTDFKGHNPVGTSAIVSAKTEEDAVELIKAALIQRGLKWDGTLKEVDLTKEQTIILNDGEY